MVSKPNLCNVDVSKVTNDTFSAIEFKLEEKDNKYDKKMTHVSYFNLKKSFKNCNAHENRLLPIAKANTASEYHIEVLVSSKTR